MFNVGRFFIKNDSAILCFQWLFIEILSYYFKIFITNVCMSRFYGTSQNMWFQIATVMVFYAFWNSTATPTNVIFSLGPSAYYSMSCCCSNLLWSFTLKRVFYQHRPLYWLLALRTLIFFFSWIWCEGALLFHLFRRVTKNDSFLLHLLLFLIVAVAVVIVWLAVKRF